MKLGGLSIGLAVLAILVGLLYWSNRESSAKSSEAASSRPPALKILDLNPADIIQVEIKRKDSDVVLAKKGSGAWQITLPKEFAVDSSTVSTLLSTLSSLNAERVVDERADDLKSYGLAPPSAELTVTERGNKSRRLLLGDETPSRNGAYAALAGDPRVFTIATYNKSSLDRGLNDLRDKRFLTIESDKINRLELLAKNRDLEFDHYKDHWQIVKPRPMRADSDPIEAFVRTLTNARIDLNQPGQDQERITTSFPQAERVGTIKVMSDTAAEELNIRKIAKDYYARSSVLDAPYRIANDVAQEFSKPIEDFRNKKLFDFGYSDPGKIEFKDGTRSYFLTRGGFDWWGPDGKKLEPAGANSFVDKLRDLKADKFVESVLETPSIEITVTPANGGQVEKVAFAKTATAYIAKRENDPSLYQVDAKAVEELEHAAAEMKAAGK